MSKQITVKDILISIDTASARMSTKNPHRILLAQCGAAIIELAQRAAGVEPQHLAAPEQA